MTSDRDDAGVGSAATATRSQGCSLVRHADNPEAMLRGSASRDARIETPRDPSVDATDVTADSPGVPHLGFSDRAALTTWTEDEVMPQLVDWISDQLGREIPEMAASAAEVIPDEKLPSLFMSQSTALLSSWLVPRASPNPLKSRIEQNIRGQLGQAQTGQLPPLPSFLSTRMGAQDTAHGPKTPDRGVETVIWQVHQGDGRSSPYKGTGVERTSKSRRTNNRHRYGSDEDHSEDDRRHRRQGRDRSRSHSRRRKSSSRRRRSGRRDSSSSDSDRSDSDSDVSERRPRARRSQKNVRLKVIRALKDLFTKAVDYRQYRLQRTDKAFAGSSSDKMNKYRRRLDVYMTGRTFTGSDPIAILEFLA